MTERFVLLIACLWGSCAAVLFLGDVPLWVLAYVNAAFFVVQAIAIGKCGGEGS